MRKGLTLLLFVFAALTSRADHILGGSLDYRWVNRSGNSFTYNITLTIYRDCNKLQPFDDTAFVYAINLVYGQKITLTSKTISGSGFQVLPSCLINEPQGCFEVAKYEGVINLPYSERGYFLYYSTCCKNETPVNVQTTTLNSGTEDHNGVLVPGQGFTYSSFIPPHHIAEINSSPYSSVDSALSLCKGKPFSHRFEYSDPDGDSLAYFLCDSYGMMRDVLPFFTPVHYNDGYSGAQPVGGNPPLILTTEGVLSGTPTKTGFYTVTICINEYRQGQLISSHRSEKQIQVYACDIQPPKNIINCTSDLALFTNENNVTNHFEWDFGVPGISTDTSTRIFPIYHYPSDGQYNVRLVVTNPKGCTDTIFSEVKIYRDLEVKITGEDSICNGEPVLLSDASVSGTSIITGRTWKLVNGNVPLGNGPSITYHYHAPDDNIYPYTFELSITTDAGCKKTGVKIVQVFPAPHADAGPDTLLAFGEPYILPGSGGWNYQWTPSVGLDRSDVAHPKIIQPSDQTYILKAYSLDRCIDYDTVRIRYFSGPEIYVPTAFTPNGDGRNDILYFTPVSVQIKRWMILNRWGQVLYISTNHYQGWDGKWKGKDQPPGTYIWMAEAFDPKGQHIIRKGTVSIIR